MKITKICFFIIVFVCSLITISVSQWTQTNGPFTRFNNRIDNYISAMAVKDSNLYVGSYSKNFDGSAPGFGVVLTSDYGNTFSYRSVFGYYWPSLKDNEGSVKLLYEYNGFVLLGQQCGSDGYVNNNETYFTNGIGNESFWTPRSNGLPYSDFIRSKFYYLPLCFTSDQNNIYVFIDNYSYTSLYSSSDNGGNWVMNDKSLIRKPTCTLTLTNTFVVGTDSGIFVSNKNSIQWKPSSAGLTNLKVKSLATIGNDIFAGTAQGVYRSTDQGANWYSASNGLTDTVKCFIASYNNLFAGTNSGVYITDDFGSKWKSISDSLPAVGVLSLAIQGKYIFAGTNGQGLWRRPISEITSVNGISNNLPTSYELFQNYPNPFNPTTTIAFSLPQTSNVTLKVFDVLGREIKTLVDEKKSAGSYTVQFDGNDLSSGMYFYQLQTKEFSQVKKLLLLK